MNTQHAIASSVLLIWVSATFSQTADVLRFEVASIKRNTTADPKLLST